MSQPDPAERLETATTEAREVLRDLHAAMKDAHQLAKDIEEDIEALNAHTTRANEQAEGLARFYTDALKAMQRSLLDELESQRRDQLDQIVHEWGEGLREALREARDRMNTRIGEVNRETDILVSQLRRRGSKLDKGRVPKRQQT